MGKTTTYVGLDVHKDTIVVALAEMGIRGEVREYGKITHTSAALKTLTTKLASGSATRLVHAATASNDNSPALDTSAWWSLHR